MHRSKIRVFGLALLLVLLSINVCAQQERSIAGISTKEEPPKVGLRVTKVEYGTPAHEAGLQQMDVICRYGNHQIVDAASYFAAREAYDKFPESKVEIVYWHFRERVATWIKPGRLGIEFNEYSAVAYQLDGLMQSLNMTIELPDYFVESQVAAGAMQPREKVVAEILAAIHKAETDGSLTPAQILVAKINAIPDDAPAAEIEKQSELIKQLVTDRPGNYAHHLGYFIFFKHKRYRPAAACLKRSLDAGPEDVSTRLNLGIAYFHVGMFDEADASADLGLKDSGLSEYGYAIAYQIKANAALGRRDFAKAVNFAEKSFQANPSSNYVMMLWQLAAAQTGDLEKFYEVVEATEKALPKEYAQLRCRTDAIEAYILARNNQSDKARALVTKWVGNEKLASNGRYWRKFPSGEDVLKVWKQLQDQN
jgi:tetratricopeptide (TPR) repeat protein